LPRARLVAEQQVSTDPATDLAAIDPETTALVDAPSQPLSGRPGTASLDRDDPGNIRIRTDAPGRQLLIVAERFHDGWRATCDGAAVEIVRAYGDFMGVAVPAGTHVVTLAFAPSSFRAGLRVTGAGLGLLLTSAIAIAFMRRRTSAGAGSVAPAASVTSRGRSAG
jgi:hypothetical protein